MLSDSNLGVGPSDPGEELPWFAGLPTQNLNVDNALEPILSRAEVRRRDVQTKLGFRDFLAENAQRGGNREVPHGFEAVFALTSENHEPATRLLKLPNGGGEPFVGIAVETRFPDPVDRIGPHDEDNAGEQFRLIRKRVGAGEPNGVFRLKPFQSMFQVEVIERWFVGVLDGQFKMNGKAEKFFGDLGHCSVSFVHRVE